MSEPEEDRIGRAAEWYAEQAEALQRYLNAKPPKTEAAFAVMQALAIDGGRRYRDALGPEKGSSDGQ